MTIHPFPNANAEQPTKRLDEINWDPTLGMPHGGVGDNGVKEPMTQNAYGWPMPVDQNDLARYKDGSPAGQICRTAAGLIDGDRQAQHGDKKVVHDLAAKLWGAYKGVEFTAEEVVTCMELLKIARAKAGGFNIDHYIDRAGYAALAGELAQDTGC